MQIFLNILLYGFLVYWLYVVRNSQGLVVCFRSLVCGHCVRRRELCCPAITRQRCHLANTRMKTDLNELRKRIAQLYPKRDIGDLKERDFQAEVAEQTVALYRAIISERMAEGETIECEHHTIWTHFRLMQSILREPAQQATSLFLTNRRLFRLQSTIMPDQPPTADSRDNTFVDVIPLDRIHALKKRFQIRIGEVLLGA